MIDRALGPAVGAAYVVGLPILIALCALLGVAWTKNYTVLFYSSIAIFTFSALWAHRSSFSLQLSDYLVAALIIRSLYTIFTSSNDELHAALSWVRYMPFLMVAPYVHGRLMRPEQMRLFFNALAIGAGFFLTCAAYDYFFNSPVYRGRYIFFGYDHSPLLTGMAAAILACYFASTYRLVGNIKLYVLLVLFACLLFWLGARGWFVACIIAISANISVQIWNQKDLRFLILLLISLSTIAIAVAQSEFYSKIFLLTEILESSQTRGDCNSILESGDSVRIRLGLLQQAIDIFIKNPSFGIGGGLYGINTCFGYYAFPHSTFIQIMAENGVFGLVMIFMIYISSLKKLIYSGGYCLILYLSTFLLLFTVADQIYGNMYMASATWITLGMIQTLSAKKHVSQHAAQN